MPLLILGLYFVFLSYLLIFSLFQLQLDVIYLLNVKRKSKSVNNPGWGDEWPFVTVQLPVYNEMHIVERLLDRVARLDYPKERFEIQVLDDSSNETSEIIQRKLKDLDGNGLNIEYIHRVDRTGFKAGNLNNGLKSARGEFIAIIDADFLPGKDFLLKTIPWFRDENIAVVQTRLGFLNRNHSLLTRMQAFIHSVHYTIEQKARNISGYIMNFNGTAGVWRKKAIIDAGGWDSNTLTEDLDISYRTQLKGWKFRYLDQVVTPGDMPESLRDFKNQQFRWSKGAIQNFRKNIKKLLSGRIPFLTRLNGIFHLLSHTAFLMTFLVALLTYPVQVVHHLHPEYNRIFSGGSVFILGTIVVILNFGIAYFTHNRTIRSVFEFPVYVILCMILVLGMTVNNVSGVMEGFLGAKNHWKQKNHRMEKISYVTVIEFLVVLLSLFCIVISLRQDQYIFLSFYIMLLLGTAGVSILSLIQTRPK
jgi:cellulose synthase/poly-beta-1,6-N-acetylglucosamine synthase-like glycosyltransferase